ncbi:MAG: VIT1/CCC1 transporter family protein [Candidatus Omnitrophica bacterium]|nr:VIT1/CCC1 transporter family protein [Candidatus Omnitrophota bacterium]
MPDMSPHSEKHFKGTQIVRDVVIGMADGLTVPFALAAGLSGLAAATSLVVAAGLAEIAAGSIAMGLGGYLAARTDHEHYLTEREREVREAKEVPDQEAKEVADIFKGYGMTDEQIAPILSFFRSKPALWVDFMMRFELGLEEPDAMRGRWSAFTIAMSYIIGGLIPLFPYMVYADAHEALKLSIVLTLAALFTFGYIKGRFTGVSAVKAALQTTAIGGIAASAAFFIARLFS